MAVEVFMPKMSDHMEAGEIVEWLVNEGSSVEKDQPILAITTDKATVDLPAPAAGVLKGVRVGIEPGVKVPVGETLAFIAQPDESVPVLPAFLAQGAVAAKEESSPTPQPTRKELGQIRATPVVRRMAKEMGIDLARITGTGSEGRITERDLQAFANAQAPAQFAKIEAFAISPVARRMAQELGIDSTQVTGTGPQGRITKEDIEAFSRKGALVGSDTDWIDLNSIQRLTGQRMLESVQSAPQFGLGIDVDVIEVLKFREAWMDRVVKETGERLSVTAILVQVVAFALKEFPRANVSFQSGRIKLHRQINIGVAVGTEQGLVVPVIRDADKKSPAEITRALKDFQDKAAKMRFGADDLTGGTFTISNLGMFGIDRFNAIINPPESAILAAGRIVKMPVGLPDNTIALRPILTLTLSVDHRSMDGYQGAQFLSKVRDVLENPYRLTR